MSYLLLQILICLLIAFAIGLFIGWLIWRNSNRDRVEELEAALKKCRESKAAPAAAPVVAAAPVPAAGAAAAVAAASGGGKDDLKIIWGIGPKMEQLLNNAGIETFAELSRTPVPRLQEIVRAYGSKRLTDIANEEVWPDQAAMAARGDWDALKAYQKDLSWREGGGKPQ
ncbi:MAG: hypothetical protein JJ896_11570 [Rhodothermales bacterium]|nr:hypothetical protein [Rhodothermales bacterium]MBO6780282.1 hypothetical protein [Rhodothermales bacterium]